MFDKIKTLFSSEKGLGDIMAEYNKQQQRYVSMSRDEFDALPDGELYEAALARISFTVDKYEDFLDGIPELNDTQKAFYVTQYYEMEVNNGGLCQFFVNSSRYIAPLLSECLEQIGAGEHKALFDKFITDNHIDLADLSSFDIDECDEFEEQNERYPFDSFDDAFCELSPICDLLTVYVRKNIKEF